VVFTTAVATVHYLRGQLGRGVAWCTGQGAGVDSMATARDAVLDWFRRPALPADSVLARPRLLLTTDVAAEGLDLPLLTRVVHYDLPWTAVRLQQRSGRALRLGSRHTEVEIVRLLPPPELEAALRKEAILLSKAGLPERLGLGEARDAPWRQRARIAAQWEGIAAAPGVAVVRGKAEGAVAGFRLRSADGSGRAVVLAHGATGWSDDTASIGELLVLARSAPTRSVRSASQLRAVLRGLAVRARASLKSAHGARLTINRTPAASRSIRRVLLLARQAARERDLERIALLERGLRLLQRGHTAGESRVIERLPALRNGELLAALARLPAEPTRLETVAVELVGVLLVRSER